MELLRLKNPHRIIDDIEFKYCFKCSEWKSVENFNKGFKKWDNLRSNCKSCENKSRKLRYINNREHELKKCKEYREANKQKEKERHIKYYKNNKDKISKYVKDYATKNHDIIKLKHRAYYIENRDKMLDMALIYRKNNKDKISDYHKIYFINNIDKYRARVRKYRHLKRNLNELYTTNDEKITKMLFQNKCFNCSSNEKLCIDHHYPLSKGYILKLNNAVVLCKSCNSSKGNKNPEEFYSNEKLKELSNILNTIRTEKVVYGA